MRDVLIVGAGPAGSALAILLARQGRTALLVDKAQFPREKVCGEGLMPAGVAVLIRLGIRVTGAPFHGVRYHHAGRTVTGEFPHKAMGWGIRRSVLDAALLDAARAEPNVEILLGASVESLIEANGRVLGVRAAAPGTEPQSFPAEFTVAADGANSAIRHKMGWERQEAKRHSSRRHAIRRHYQLDAPREPWVDVYLEREQETYVTPLAANQALVAALGEKRPAIPVEWDRHPAVDTIGGASPLTVRASQRVCDGLVLLGDAAGNCDPITGGGMAQAMLSAELLANYLQRDFPPRLQRLQAFDAAREAMLANYRRLTAGVLALSRHPHWIPPTLAALHHAPGLFSHLLGMAGGASPRGVAQP
jgi:flavin-dependent dehydrogenase